MKDPTPYYLKVLRKDFETRQKRNAQFSMRSYARTLGLEAPSLSGVLKGNRRISKNKIDQVIAKLGLSPKESQLFVESNTSELTTKINFQSQTIQENNFQLEEEAHYRVIAEGDHYTLLSLIETKDFQSNTKLIASRLQLSELRINNCLQNLIDAQLINIQKGQIKLTQQGVKTTEDISSAALRKSAEEDLTQAQRKLEEVDLMLRDFSSCTMTVNPEDLPELKKMIREFRRKFMSVAEFSEGTEVYKLNMQFYPLTQIKK